jgi:hypothetical protein
MEAIAKRLAALGGSIEGLDRYSGRRLRKLEARFYNVEVFAFPRITRDSFLGGDLPPGTMHVGYSIDLTNEPPSPLDQSSEAQVIAEFSKEASREMDS